MLRLDRLLVQRPSKRKSTIYQDLQYDPCLTGPSEILRPARNDIYFMRNLCYHWYLDGRCEQLAQPPRRSLRPRIRRRRQIEHNARLRC
jgi:hypothetical protein